MYVRQNGQMCIDAENSRWHFQHCFCLWCASSPRSIFTRVSSEPPKFLAVSERESDGPPPTISRMASSDMRAPGRSGTCTIALQVGHNPEVPAEDSLTFNTCPFGHTHRIDMAAPRSDLHAGKGLIVENRYCKPMCRPEEPHRGSAPSLIISAGWMD
jgi:hypothetical protein